MKEYALYKGDDFIDLGTIEELSRRLNIKKDTLYFYKSGVYKRRHIGGKNARILIEIEDDNEEEVYYEEC